MGKTTKVGIFMAFKKKNGDKVSKILLGNKIEGASVTANSKYISVFDGMKNSYIPKTSANLKQLDKKFGKPSISNYRGKNRKVWFDHDIYE